MTAEVLADLRRYSERVDAIYATLDPTLPGLTRLVMAGDMAGAERVAERYEAGGLPVDDALRMIGSYARLDYARRWLDRDALLDALPGLWPGCDPDDTDPAIIALWRAGRAKAGRIITDGPDLPPGDRLTVYRGQPRDARIGCAWSLDRRVAQKFAAGAWARVPVRGGVVLRRTVPRDAVLAYLTARNEAEVIIDPEGLR